MVNQYEFSVAGTDSAEPVLFVEQSRFKLKEDIRFYGDRARTDQTVITHSGEHDTEAARSHGLGSADEQLVDGWGELHDRQGRDDGVERRAPAFDAKVRATSG